MARRQRHRFFEKFTEVEPLIQLWLLRMLVPLGGHQHFVRAHCFSEGSAAVALELDNQFQLLWHSASRKIHTLH